MKYLKEATKELPSKYIESGSINKIGQARYIREQLKRSQETKAFLEGKEKAPMQYWDV